MKKLLYSILIFMLVFVITSCENRQYGILFYQDNKITAECRVNDKYNVIIVSAGETRTLEIESPNELKGIKFDFSNGQSYAISDDVKIPVNKDDLKGIASLIGIFSLDEGYITSANIRGEQTVTFDSPLCTYIMSFDERGYPSKAKISDGSFSFDVEIKTLKLEKHGA